MINALGKEVTVGEYVKEQLRPVLEALRQECITPKYRAECSDEQLLAFVVSYSIDWDAEASAMTCAYILEEANMHTEADKMFRLANGQKNVDPDEQEVVVEDGNVRII